MSFCELVPFLLDGILHLGHRFDAGDFIFVDIAQVSGRVRVLLGGFFSSR